MKQSFDATLYWFVEGTREYLREKLHSVTQLLTCLFRGTREDVLFEVNSLSSTRRGRVLLIDDEAFIVAALRRLLSSEHDVMSVMNVPDALALIREGHYFDVILCDLRMPGMTGFDFYEHLKAIASDMARRIVFCTGATPSTDTRDFFENVPNRILEKPFDPLAVRSLVRGLVNNDLMAEAV